jgi:hypothetical protein
MERGTGSRGRGETPNALQTANTTPEQSTGRTSARGRRWREQHPERAAELSRKSSLKYYHKNKARLIDENLEVKRELYRKNRQLILAQQSERYHQNPEPVRAHARKQYRREKESLTGGGTVFNEFDYWWAPPKDKQ